MLDSVVLEVEWCFGDECFDGGVEGVCDFLEGFYGDVSLEVVHGGSSRNSDFVGEVFLGHSPIFEDEFDVFVDIHNSCRLKMCCKGISFLLNVQGYFLICLKNQF